MNVKIYQGYYSPEQVSFLESAFTPYNNQHGDTTLLEYAVWRDLYKEHADSDLHWGLLSWRWREKMNLPGELFVDWIKANPGYDVYFLNPFNHLIDYHNTWIQGEEWHPGIIDWCNVLLKKLGYSFDINHLEYLPEEWCTCHYFIGNSKFWSQYLKWLENIISIVKDDEYLNNFMFVKTTLYRKKEYRYFPFLIERLFTLFCILNRDVKSLSYPYESFAFPHTLELLKEFYKRKQRTREVLYLRAKMLGQPN